MAEEMDIDSGYDARDRELSPRRDYNRSDDRGRDGYRRERSPPRRRRDDYGSKSLDELKDKNAPPGSRSSDRNFENSVFIGNLGYDVDSHRLRDLFKEAGNIVRADVITQGGRHKGMATVEFSNRDDASRAISQFHQTRIDGREVFVRHDNPPPAGARREREDRGGDRFDDRRDFRRDRDDRGYGRDRYGGDRYGGDRYGGDRYGGDRYGGDRYGGRRERREPRKIDGPHYEAFVGNLPYSARWQDLKDLFRDVGHVLQADVKEDDNGRSRGMGMVYFATQEEVKAAIERFNGYEMDGRKIDVREGKKNSDTLPPHLRAAAESGLKNSEFTEGVEGEGDKNDTIYVDNLPFATDNVDLVELFATIDPVTKAEIKYVGGRPAGTGVVQFASEDVAETAIARLNNYNYGGRDLKISYAKKP